MVSPELSDTEVITVAFPESQPGGSEVTLQVDQSADDYKETKTGSCGSSDTTHDLFTVSDYKHAFRFRGVPIPRGATILAARLDLYAPSSADLAKPVLGVAQGEAAGDAPAFSKRALDISNAPKTQARALVENLAPWSAGVHNPVADVTAIVQEIVNRADYASGNAIKLFLLPRSTAAFRRTSTYNSSPARGAKLIVRYLSPR